VDITGIMLSAIVVLFLLSGPRGKSRYHPLGFGILIAALSAVYAAANNAWAYYLVAAAAAAKGLWDYRRWQR